METGESWKGGTNVNVDVNLSKFEEHVNMFVVFRKKQ